MVVASILILAGLIIETGGKMDVFKLLRSRLFAVIMIITIIILSFVIIIISQFSRKYAIRFCRSYIVFALSVIFLISLIVCSLYRLKTPLLDISKTGSVLFHLALVLIVAGAVYNYFFRISGYIIITEGQVVSCNNKNMNNLRTGIFSSKNFSNYMLKLNRLNVKYKFKKLIKTSAHIILNDNENSFIQEGNISINYPFFYKGYKFLLSSYGYAPRFVLKKNNRIVRNAFVNLKLLAKEGMKSDKFYFNDWLIHVFFYPDYYSDGNREITRTMGLKNPVFRIRISESKNGRVLYNGLLKYKKTLRIGDYTLSADDIRYWVQLYISSEQGIKLIFSGFWIAIIGLILKFFKKGGLNRWLVPASLKTY